MHFTNAFDEQCSIFGHVKFNATLNANDIPVQTTILIVLLGKNKKEKGVDCKIKRIKKEK